MTKPRRQPPVRGFTVVELMVALVVFGLLFAFAYPSYVSFIQNSQIRSTAESVSSGLQLARAEAIRTNRNVQFQMPNTLNGYAMAGGTDWTVKGALMATPSVFNQPVQSRTEGSLSSSVRAGIADAFSATAAAPGTGMPAVIVFTGMGRLNLATTARQIDFTGVAGSRRLTIVLAPGGDIRLCDPALSLAINPQGCA